jgi:two-component system LytT family response regulator
MSLRAVIIDDDELGIEALRLLIDKYIEGVRVVAHSASATEAIRLIEDYTPEIVFLDINMPEMNGFELLEKLKWRGFHLVFTTAHHEYAIKALRVEAMDYLLKPIDYNDLRFAVNKIKNQITDQQNTAGKFNYDQLTRISQLNKNKLAVNANYGVEAVNLSDIICFESLSNYTKIHLSDARTILTPKTLKEFENQFCNTEHNFMRVHNSYVINLSKVLRFIKEEKNIVMINHQQISLSKSRKNDFFKWLGE